ncbi:MAG: hypothetical protein K1060chlam3_00212 [Candidatus Anoxychlamydiales bacterium]|nr:hypothetical protein [Candidatus Anoxychlamydiales bacterium]
MKKNVSDRIASSQSSTPTAPLSGNEVVDEARQLHNQAIEDLLTDRYPDIYKGPDT